MKVAALVLVALALLLTAAPAVAQSRVYTNADLGTPLAATRPDPAAAAAMLAPYQPVFTAPHPNEAQVVGVFSSPTAGPFGEFPLETPQRAGSLGSFYDPFVYGRFTPYLGQYGGHRLRDVRSFEAPIGRRPWERQTSYAREDRPLDGAARPAVRGHRQPGAGKRRVK